MTSNNEDGPVFSSLTGKTCPEGQYNAYQCNFWLAVGGTNCNMTGHANGTMYFRDLETNCSNCNATHIGNQILGPAGAYADFDEASFYDLFSGCTYSSDPSSYSYVIASCDYSGCQDPSWLW